MPLNELVARARRASKRPPRYLVRRVVEIGAERLRRPWSRVYPRVLTPASVVSAAGARSIDELWDRLQRTPFFVNAFDRDATVRAFSTRFEGARGEAIAAADRAVRHEFDLLGSGPVSFGRSLPWHADFKTGREWPLQYAPDIEFAELDKPTDVKVPWELSRAQHFTSLGQAYWLTGDERYASEFAAEVADWIERNPWSHGVNWICAMDVALRAVSWIWGFHFMSGSPACASQEFRGAFLRALYLHGEYIATHIERGDVNGNHYLCDAVGLVFVGSFFESTAKGRRWLAEGRRMLVEEIFNQTSTDGVDFEKSTAYHRLVLEAFVTCAILLRKRGDELPKEWTSRLERMCEFVEAYVKPDGRLPLVGDADDGRIQKLGPQDVNDHRYLLSTAAVLFGRSDFKRSAARFWEESFWLLGSSAADRFDRIPPATAPRASAAFADGGFYVLRTDRAHVFIDCGEVGMHGRGGHGHNDILGFELWLDGANLITDCGAYVYTASREWRNRFRGTAFHNVVQVDGEELNRFTDPPSLWQLRDDARPTGVTWRTGGEVDCFAGGHTGYHRFDPPIAVRRTIELAKSTLEVFVHDRIEGSGRHDLVWRFHCDPSVAVEVVDSDIRLVHERGEAWMQVIARPALASIALDDGWVSPSYGVRRACKVVTLRRPLDLPTAAAFRFGVNRLDAGLLQTLEFTCVNS